MQPASHAIDGGKVDLVGQGCGRLEERPDVLDTADSGQAGCGGGAQERQGMPGTLQDVRGEEPDATGAEAHGGRGEAVDVLSG